MTTIRPTAYECPRCGHRVPDDKLACGVCIAHIEPRPKVKPVKLKPDVDGLFDGVPGINPYHLPKVSHESSR